MMRRQSRITPTAHWKGEKNSWWLLRQKHHSLQQHQAESIHQYTDDQNNVGRSGPVQILGIHTNPTNQGWNINKWRNEVKIRPAQAHQPRQGNQYHGKTTPSMLAARRRGSFLSGICHRIRFGRKRFWSQLNKSKTVRDRPHVPMVS